MSSTSSRTLLLLLALISSTCLVQCQSDDLSDFEFGGVDEKSFDYVEEQIATEASTNFVPLEAEESGRKAIDWKEKVLRKALAKALTNRELRQKFAEVMPILRILSAQQRLTLSALISAQISARPGQELKLDQVKMMFGNDKKLILPLIFDLANLVRTAAKTYGNFDYKVVTKVAPKTETQTPISRRTLDLTEEELAYDELDDGALPDLFPEDDMLDPKLINEALMSATNKTRPKRSVTDFVHKLPKSMPEPNGRAFFSSQLNTTHFAGPYENLNPHLAAVIPEKGNDLQDPPKDVPTYSAIEDLAFAELNGTVVEQPGNNQNASNAKEELPSPESLVAGMRYRVIGNKLSHGRIPPPKNRISSQRKRAPITPKQCERFTASMCIRTEDYPIDQIMGSIRRHKHAMSALLAEYRDKSAELEHQEYLEEVQLSSKRREDENAVTPGGMCASSVRYARPQKARSASGEWKYIVNTGQHTQTLRLEKCSNPQESCSFLSQNYRSRCIQVYNYHRLLSWDQTRGLHVDIFKVPTCCSCHVDGYRESFPPLGGTKVKGFTPAHTYQSKQPYNTVVDELDYEDEEEEDDSLGFQYSGAYKKNKIPPGGFDASELDLSSTNVRHNYDRGSKTKIGPTIGTYLSPPDSLRESQYNFKRGVHHFDPDSARYKTRRPSYNSYQDGEERADLEISESIESVNVASPPANKPTTPVTYSIPILTPTSPPVVSITPSPPNRIPQQNPNSKSVFVTKYSNPNSEGNTKRINYNYHPIIDYFEDRHQSHQQQRHKVPLQTGRTKFRQSSINKERRLGMGTRDGSWHPVMIES